MATNKQASEASRAEQSNCIAKHVTENAIVCLFIVSLCVAFVVSENKFCENLLTELGSIDRILQQSVCGYIRLAKCKR